MSSPATTLTFVENVIPALNRSLEEGQRAALVTLVRIDGSSPRPLGSQIGVTADGRSVGMITGGCAEKAIVAEALRCIENAENEIVRYGDGSPYVDVVLPCGSGIELYIEVQSSIEIVREIYTIHKDRELAFMAIDLTELTTSISRTSETAHSNVKFIKTYSPDYRIYVFGEGTNLASFCTLANAAGMNVEAFSPDEEALNFLKKNNIKGRHIHRKTDLKALSIDNYTAIVTLFHEHEWESSILHAALNSQADYIGALGSRNTHQARLDSLAAMSPTKQSSDVIHGPVGLDIGAQSPNEIAVSIIAEIIKNHRHTSP